MWKSDLKLNAINVANIQLKDSIYRFNNRLDKNVYWKREFILTLC